MVDGLVGEFQAFGAGRALVEEAEFDVVGHAAVADEVEGLEHEPDVVGAHGGALVVGQVGDVVAGEEVGAGGGDVEQAEQ